MKLSKNTREKLRNKFGCSCAFCGSSLSLTGWHAEQIGEEYVYGGLVAICKDCRTTKGNATTEAFRESLQQQVKKAQRHSVNYRTALRFGLVSETTDPVVFWFEKYQARSAGSQSTNYVTRPL